MISPSRQICQERICTPAVKVPSVSKVKIASPVEPAVKTLCTLGNNSKFITTRNASQCSACVVIRCTRAALSPALGHPFPIQTSPMIGAVVLTWWLGAYALVFGVSLVVLAFKLHARLEKH